MGLFDFIKKKLFGKSKKVEESKKVLKDSPKDISVKPKPKPKKKDEPKPKKLVSKKKESKKEEKGFILKIKDAIISSPKKVEPEDDIKIQTKKSTVKKDSEVKKSKSKKFNKGNKEEKPLSGGVY